MQLKDESSDSTSIEQLEALHDRIKHLQKSVDDAEYKHQMAARQWRRGECRGRTFVATDGASAVVTCDVTLAEKSQLEKLQAETEAATKEAEDRVTELEAEVTQVRDEQTRNVEQSVLPVRARCEKLEDIVRDLDHCLRSSKESEARVAAQCDEYRNKCKCVAHRTNYGAEPSKLSVVRREQEKRLGDLEDDLREQQEASESLANDAAHDAKCLRANVAEKQRQLDEAKDDVKTLQVRCW